MGRRLLTVCVVCLLCSHCSAHRRPEADAAEGSEGNASALPRPDEQLYIDRIFRKFGNGDTMDLEGFAEMAKALRLNELLDLHSMDAASQPRQEEKLAQKCISSKDFLLSYILNSTDSAVIDSGKLKQMCPILLYQLTKTEPEKEVQDEEECILSHLKDEAIEADHITDESAVWLYSTLSIIVISACGLLGVIVIPFMQRSFYHQLIQFLIALAVGTLAGDALLHLLPHAMMSHGHSHGKVLEEQESEDEHSKNMWRGFVAMVGLVFFFFTERFLTLGAEWRKKRQNRNKFPERVRVMRDSEVKPNSNGEKSCKHKYSSYPYCYDEIDSEVRDDHHNRNHKVLRIPQLVSGGGKPPAAELDLADDLDGYETPLHLKPDRLEECTSVSRGILAADRLVCNRALMGDRGDTVAVGPLPSGVQQPPSPADKDRDSYTVILREHESKHHGHSHTHGHVHSAPKSMSSVAWMVLMGDGLHNFTDGMAIGAAFASDLAGGFSTAVAVFCHELPHELGDFAVLLKAGMTAKQAVFYNMLSSVLCFVGMIAGIVLGNNENASSWLFALAAGMFLHIALVDMIPELTSSHSNEGSSLLQCVIHFAGLLVGLSIMLLIALYEDNLKNIFTQ